MFTQSSIWCQVSYVVLDWRDRIIMWLRAWCFEKVLPHNWVRYEDDVLFFDALKPTCQLKWICSKINRKLGRSLFIKHTSTLGLKGISKTCNFNRSFEKILNKPCTLNSLSNIREACILLLPMSDHMKAAPGLANCSQCLIPHARLTNDTWRHTILPAPMFRVI